MQSALVARFPSYVGRRTVRSPPIADIGASSMDSSCRQKSGAGRQLTDAPISEDLSRNAFGTFRSWVTRAFWPAYFVSICTLYWAGLHFWLAS